jgi:hypothetical protein
LEFARRLGSHAPLGRAAIGVASAEGSGSWAALAALRHGPSCETHEEVLAFVRELVSVQPRALPRWVRRLLGRDPGQAVVEALAMGEAKQQLPEAETAASCSGEKVPNVISPLPCYPISLGDSPDQHLR